MTRDGPSAGGDRPADGVPPRLRDMALLLPFGGLLLTMPPLVMIFSRSVTLFGVPLLYLYLFALWCGLIVVGALLARALCRAEHQDGIAPPPPRRQPEPDDPPEGSADAR